MGINSALYLDKGAIVSLPGPGEIALFSDASGNVFKVDSTGAVSAIGGGGSGGANPDWFGYMTAVFQAKTGVSPLAIGSTYSDLIYYDAAHQNLLSGAGATYAYQAAMGIIEFQGPNASTAGSSRFVINNITANTISNVRTKRWMLAMKIAITAGNVAGNRFSFGGAVSFASPWGLGATAAGGAANWSYANVGTPRTVDLGVPIVLGQFRTIYIANFNLVDLAVNIDVAGGAADTVIAGEVANIPNSAGLVDIGVVGDGTQAAQGKFQLDSYLWIGEQ